MTEVTTRRPPSFPTKFPYADQPDRSPGFSSSLDTLVQLSFKDTKRTPADTQKDLKRKAIRMKQTFDLIWPLIDLNSSMENQYWSSYYCCRELKQEGVYLRAKYCNKRWCFTCNAIRCAKMINNYMPIFKLHPHAQFVTLTRPNVKAEDLPEEINCLVAEFRIMIRYLRGMKKIDLRGLRKLEVTYNWYENTYHPHFHLIVHMPGAARELIEEWLFRNPTAKRAAQHMREADQGSFTELFKYAAKIAADKDMSPFAQDVIFQALANHRIYQPFGINKVIKDPEDPQEVTQAYGSLDPEIYKVWYFNNDKKDWDSLQGESLIDTIIKSYNYRHETVAAYISDS